MSSATAKRPMSNKKFLAIWIPIVAVVAIVAIGANIAIGMFRGAIESYMGAGTYDISNTAEGSELDTDYYGADYETVDDAKAASSALVEEIAGEGMTLVKNNGTLPLAAGAVTLLGRGAADPVYGGSGSGTADTRTAINIRAGVENGGFTVNGTVYDQLAAFAEANPAAEGGRTNIVMDKPDESNYNIGEMPVDQYTQESVDSFAEFGDAAVVVIARGGGEGGDLATNMEQWDENAEPGQHQLELNKDEKDLLELAKSNFDNVVVVVNASTSLELGALQDDEGIDGVLLAGSPGAVGFGALGPILAGEINPSGRTVDIFSSDFTADPTFANFGDYAYSNVDDAYFVDYEEGIYVGYRYYETAAVEGFIDYDAAVVYPFGYGLSYTEFDYAVTGQSLGATDGEISVDVEVTNSGDTAGKDVVQLYYTAPYTPGGIEKSSVVLGSFAKTDVLEPGASETVTLSIPVEQMASYDSEGAGAYVLDAGTYEIKVQTDSHTVAPGTSPIAYTVAETVAYTDGRASDETPATNQFADATAPFTDGTLTEFSRADFAGTFPNAPEGDDLVANDATLAAFAPYDAAAAAEENGDVEAPTWGADGDLSLIDMRGLAWDDPAWDSFLDQLELADIVDMLTSGAYNTAGLPEIGKIRTNDLDGPAGFSSFINPDLWTGTAFPSEYLLGQTWNVDLAEKMGVAIGNEALTMGANGWYAPAANLHRSPFAGRNFEYYSEDPTLSGMLATAAVDGALTKGVYSFTKHFAMNDQETNRVNGMGIATWATEQTIREIYLKPFEMIVKDASGELSWYDADNQKQTTEIGATAMMSSFNRIGATWAGGSSALMHDVLREEWGFTGFVITDFNLYPYMYVDEAWAARGTDHMLTFSGTKTVDDTESAFAQSNIRYAAHNVLYTVANSNAVNGMAPGATLAYQPAAWEIWVTVVTVVLGALIVAGIVWMVVRVRRHRRRPVVTTEDTASA
ncbi:glycoside hydrolase family 3 N-terminal domain-containing protein [Microbacterium sp. cx-59]|uniref:glycoside hydrolase family 3 N-terminal domain-containing protein n=1 Tax=Microbacterium sp. cx-59 TaxID=2891207 RepID=UPI001E40B260|nr:glycoside hydrolase family 3 N-terminal domain-containing protein [Microbacterium sp. cx-59]MCC4909232.1 glycoside hydrolase family 3 C-terminal domain-containing protein [Microbacterium sp. cx-59]